MITFQPRNYRLWLRVAQRAAVLMVCAGLVMLAGCAKKEPVGEINDAASIALLSFESVGDGYDGVVYREVNDFDALMAYSDVPLLVVFYSPYAASNARVIPRLEQMADDYKDQLKIVWVDAEAQPDLVESFQVDTLPQFSVIVESTLKRSMIGFDEEGAVRLAELLEPYLANP